MNNGYSSYLNYKQILKLLKKETSVYEISNITGIHESTVYRLINTLINENIIIFTGYHLATKDNAKPERLFKVKKDIK